MTTETMEQEAVNTKEIRKEIEIAAPIEIAFQALLDELGPEAQMPDGKTLSMKIEAWPGGRWYRDLGNNTGHLWGHVQVIKPPTLLEICGPMFMSYPAINHLEIRLEEIAGGTRLSLRHRAIGMIDAQHRAGVSTGWRHMIESIEKDCSSNA